MPSFKYTAYSKEGKEIKSTIEADDLDSAKEKIKNDGNSVLDITEEGMFDKDINISFGAKKASSRDLSIFCRQFVSISGAGVSIVDALEMLGDQTENKALKEAIFNTKVCVQKGETLAIGMKKQGKIFPSLLINMVEAGEQSGNLDIAFDRMATQFEKDTRLKQLIKKSMMYPIVLSIVIVGVVIGMMAFVVPTFSDMYADMDQTLPAITRAIVALSDFIVTKYYILIIVVAAAVVGIKAFKSSKQGTYFFANIAMKAPVFGKLTIKSASAQFARTLSTLTAAGISMIDALDITARTMKNVYFRDQLIEAKDKVAQGRPLSEPLRAGNVFPNMIVHMIGIGEQTGNMEDMLVTAASYYEEEVEVTTEQISTVVEPMIIVVMAGIVGVIIMAILIPMFGMYSLAGGDEASE